MDAEPSAEVVALSNTIAAKVAREARDSPLSQSLTEEELVASAHMLAGKVVVITGAASGFGKLFSVKAAGYGAKLVMGDRNLAGLEQVVQKIESAGGKAVAIECDVTNWDQQYKLFELAVKSFGRVDVVIPNAGIALVGDKGFLNPDKETDGRLKEPSLATTRVNLFGLMYTAKLGLAFLDKNEEVDGIKGRLVLIGSVASIVGFPSGPEYTVTKHGVLGLYRSIFYDCIAYKVVLSICCPWFVDTPLLEPQVLLLISGLPRATQEDVVNSFVYASVATQSGNVLATDHLGVFSLPHATFEASDGTGYYKQLMTRSIGAIKVDKIVNDGLGAILRTVTGRLIFIVVLFMLGSTAYTSGKLVNLLFQKRVLTRLIALGQQVISRK